MFDSVVDMFDFEVGKAGLADIEIRVMVFFEFVIGYLVGMVIDWKNKKSEELFANNAMMDSFFHYFVWLRALH